MYRRWRQSANPSIDDLPVALFILRPSAVVLADLDTTIDAWTAELGALAGLTLSAPAATNRPAWNPIGGAGGNPLAVFDGVDNVLRNAAVVLNDGVSISGIDFGFAGRVNVSGSGTDTCCGYSTGYLIGSAAGGGIMTCNQNGVGGTDDAYATAESSTGLWSTGWSGAPTARKRARFNGSVERDVPGNTSRADAQPFAIGAQAAGTAASSMQAQACYLAKRQLSAGELAVVRATITTLTGIVC